MTGLVGAAGHGGFSHFFGGIGGGCLYALNSLRQRHTLYRGIAVFKAIG